MRRRTFSTLLTGVLLVAGLGPAPALAVDSSENAALRYYRAWTLLVQDNRELVRRASHDVAEETWTAPEAVTLEWLDELPTELLLEATALESIDFAIDYSKGPFAKISHLSAMRDSARIMVLGARIKLDGGDIDGAVEMIAAGYRISEHCIHDKVLISSLVSAAILAQTDEMAQYADTLGVLTPQHRAHLAHTLARFERHDPFGVKAAVQGERDFTLGWIEHQLALGNRENIVNFIPLVSSDGDDAQIQALHEALHRGERLQLEIRLARMYYNQALAAWERPDAHERLTELSVALEEGGFGPLGAVVGASLVRVHEHSLRASHQLEIALQRFAN